MTRLLKLITVLISIVSLASAQQLIDTFNTPNGPITQGVTTMLTWTLVPNANVSDNSTAALSAVEITTKNTTLIEAKVPLKPLSYSWTVNLSPATYNLALNDGTGLKQTAEVEIVAPGDSGKPPSSPSSTPSDSGSTTTGTTKSPETPPASSPKSSASSIFSGYDVVFGLSAVAIAMVQF